MQSHDTTNPCTPKLCECGCGLPAPVADKNHTRDGIVRGQPRRFIAGHQNRVRVYPSAEERFWAKVDKRGPDDCWEWTASCHDYGYGQFWTGEERISAHRFSYVLVHGEIADGAFICHTCDNPPCCNPAHLFAGQPKDNTKDMMEKGRHRPAPSIGESNPSAKLVASDVIEIRGLIEAHVPTRQIAERFGVSTALIRSIGKRRVWKHI